MAITINGSGTITGLSAGAISSDDIDDNLVLRGTGAITLPKGTTAEKPTSADGLLRYNTTKKTIEGVLSTGWSRDWQAMTMAPCFYGFDSIDTTGISGWKTIRVTPDFNNGLAGSSVYDTSTGRFTPNEEGWYAIMFNHFHGNGSHGQYRTQITHSIFGAVSYQWTPNSDGSSIVGFTYCNGSSHYIECSAYHDNNNHADSNDDRRIFQAAFRIIGADNA
jgi:hypothetical protein